MKRRSLAVLLLIVLRVSTIYPQSSTTAGLSTSTAGVKKTVFPQWVLDLRRAEIVAFGSFPFTMFFATFGVDTYRAATHNLDSRYLPWPAKGAGAVEMDTDEHMLTLGIAIAGSLSIALADHLILRIKRARAERQRLDLPEGDIIILRKPWPPDDAATGDTASGETAQDQAAPGGAAESEPDSAP